jgi:RNA polymerase-binding transcription factor DksA
MDQAHARALLAGERARLERLLAAESQEPDAADLGDEVDDADRRDDRQTGRAVDELLGTRWAALERAAARLAAGSYGRSVRSGRPLLDERLEADPLAELTVEEAAAAERGAMVGEANGSVGYAVSLLKAYWGEAATAENDYCYDHLPRMTGDHGTYRQVLDMIDGKIKGYFLWGQNPAVGSANGKAQRLGMANLDWLVVRDLFLIESATFWKDSPEVDTGEIVPTQCRTEVFVLPAASHVEKEGTFTQTQRMLQWREKALDPPGDCRSDLWFSYHLGRIIREQLAASTLPRDRPVLDLAWDYPMTGSQDEPSAAAVLREMGGFEVATGRPLSSYTELKDDGSTVGGCWIYTGVFADGVNQAARRKPGSEQSWVAGDGAGRGQPTVACSTTARPPTPRDGPGASARPTSGGTPRPVSGPVTTCPTSRRPSRRTIARRRAPAGRPRWPAMTRSSCRATARAGCTSRPGWSTGRCPPTTNRPSRQSRTRCTASRPTRRGWCTNGRTTP